MAKIKEGIDYRGARGSNTGDQFHEFWALLQVLNLLDQKNQLSAVSVEGVVNKSSTSDSAEPKWDGVDCALYYGGNNLQSADLIELVQLKYSAADPTINWSPSRITKNTARKGNNSVIHKMAKDFSDASAYMKQSADLRISFISNQKLSPKLATAFNTQWSGSLQDANINQSTKDIINKLIDATGLTETEYKDFIKIINFSECGATSRFALRESVIGSVTKLIGDDVSSEVRDLQIKIRELMLPERSGEFITEKDVLLWFGLSGREGLFPCKPEIQIPQNTVRRSVAAEVIDYFNKGERLVLVHGVGGCGKTTLVHQIIQTLPKDSVPVLFDCFGGGRYIYSDDKRHIAENAFLHIVNELSLNLGIPLFLPRNFKHPATINTLMAKLRLAGETYKQVSSDGIIILIIDAADNSVSASEASDPQERPFIFDLFNANLSSLPTNVRFLVSCRTARRDSLQIPFNTPEILCPLFSLIETEEHLKLYYPAYSKKLVDQFHALSNANPRVQAYAIASSKNDINALLQSLLPSGKSLSDILRSSFEFALQKIGQRQIFDKIVSILAYLPAPISITSFARIAGSTKEIIRDFVLDLSPGLRLKQDDITIADEDFDQFIKKFGASNCDMAIDAIAKDFINTFIFDSYSSIHVADLLIQAGRSNDILSVIEKDPQPAAINDPIVRRQVQVRRLRLSLQACSKSGTSINALKTILISAEAVHDDTILNELLSNELDLSVEFGASSLRRSILLDPERISEHGSFLAHDALRSIRKGDYVTAREQLYFYEAWLKRRNDVSSKELRDWNVSDSDISACIHSILELAGPTVALSELLRWTPRNVAIRVALILVPNLIACGKIDHLRRLLNASMHYSPWDLLLIVPLAMAGEAIDKQRLEKSLRRIKQRFIPDASQFNISYGNDAWQQKLLDILITSCELAFKLSIADEIISKTVNRIIVSLEGKEKCRLYESNVSRFDGLIRCWLLRNAINGQDGKDEEYISYINGLNPEFKPNKNRLKKQKHKKSPRDSIITEGDEDLNKKVVSLFPVYQTRLEILKSIANDDQITDEYLDKLKALRGQSYNLDPDYTSTYLRSRAAMSVMNLLIVEKLNALDLLKRAQVLAAGKIYDPFKMRHQKLWSYLKYRTTESQDLLQLVCTTVDDVKNLRAASSEKIEAIVKLSRLILQVSRDDANSIFNEAITIAKEIDREAFDQIKFVSVINERSNISSRRTKIVFAEYISAFVTGAAIRLSDFDGFPWSEAVQAITCLDEATALGVICRWADDGTVKFDHTLNQYILTSLKRGFIDLPTSISLNLLNEHSKYRLISKFMQIAIKDPNTYTKEIDELSRQILLFTDQYTRLNIEPEFIDLSTSYDGPPLLWFRKLKKTAEFLKILSAKSDSESDELVSNSTKLNHSSESRPIFELGTQTEPFINTDSITNVLISATKSDKHLDAQKLLREMRDASSHPRDRIKFLNALQGVDEKFIWDTHRLKILIETLDLWRGTSAVEHWCQTTLPDVIVRHFKGTVGLINEKQHILTNLIDYTGLDPDDRLKVVLSGVSKFGDSMNSQMLFSIAIIIARSLETNEANIIVQWYSNRLKNRLSHDDNFKIPTDDIPNSSLETVSRFLFSLMSDIDTRVRWQAAHALRLIARFGNHGIIKKIMTLLDREKDDVFRDPNSPFYFLAAQLWLMISLYRISSETPETLSFSKDAIFRIATSNKFPHVAIREYSKRILLQLSSNNTITLTKSENDQIKSINTALKGQVSEKEIPHRTFGYGRVRKKKRRFQFDDTDTLRYWYIDILHMYETASR